MTRQLPLWSAAWTAPPLRASDGLAADAPEPPRRGRVLRNPFLRLLLFLLMVAALAVVGGIALFSGGATYSLVAGAALELVAVTIAYLLLVMVVEGRRPPLELAPRRWTGFLGGLALGAALFVACYLVIMAMGGFRIAGFNPTANIWPTIFVVGGVAGFAEEMLFRGVLFRLTEELIGTWAAIAISGLVFGLVHLSNPDGTLWGGIAIALEAGLLFGVLYALTRSLWLTAGVHFAWNVVQGPILGVIVSGTGAMDGLFVTKSSGPAWLSGGSFGAEGSVVTVVLLVAVTVWLAVLLVRRGLVVRPWWSRRHLERARDAALAAPAAPVTDAAAPALDAPPSAPDAPRPADPPTT